MDFLKYSETVHSWNHTLSLRTTLKQFYLFCGEKLLSLLNKADIVNFVEKRLKNVSSYAVKRDIANLSSAFSYAVSKAYMSENFCKGIKKPRITEKLPLFFTEVEFDRLINCIDDHDLKELVIFAVNTGLRQSDLINLQWDQINFKKQTLILNNRHSVTKSRKIHSIPLNIKALQILTDRQINHPGSERIFIYKGKPIKQLFISHKFKKFVKNAGVNPEFSFHNLRSTFGSWLVQKGVPIYQVSKLLTNADLRVTLRYTHLSEQDLKSAVNILND